MKPPPPVMKMWWSRKGGPFLVGRDAVAAVKKIPDRARHRLELLIGDFRIDRQREDFFGGGLGVRQGRGFPRRGVDGLLVNRNRVVNHRSNAATLEVLGKLVAPRRANRVLVVHVACLLAFVGHLHWEL